MYAVIETGGKQYRVEVGTELEVELLDAAPGESIHLDRVLLVADGDTAAIGRPVVINASVAAEVLRRDRGEKTISFKYRPKARRRVKKGHSQELTVLRISDIVLDGHSAAADVAEAEAARKRDRAKLEEAARRQAAADAELAAKLQAEKPLAAPKPAKAAPEKAAPTGSSKAGASKAGAAKGAATKGSAAKAGAAKAESKPAAKAAAKTTTPESSPGKPAAKSREAGKRTTKKES